NCGGWRQAADGVSAWRPPRHGLLSQEKIVTFAWFDSRLRPSERQAGPRYGQLCARRAQQRRRDDVLPALRRRFELAVAAHEIGKSLHAVNRAAELVLDLAQHRFDEGAAERHRRL